MRASVRGIAGVLALLALVGPADAQSGGVPDPDAIRARLRERGVAPEEMVRLLEEETPSPSPTGEPMPEPAREILEEGPSPPSPVPPPPPPVAPGDSTAAAPSIEPFGADLFALSPSTFTPPLYGPIDPDYRLGPGDEIVIDVWGDAVFRLEKIVNREGNVLLPDVGQVSLQGLTLLGAKERVRARLSKAYSGFSKDPPTTFLDLSLGKLRPIKVFVVGEVRRPGAYDLSAASTVFHALYFAGGPGPDGTMREVRVLRGNAEVARLDVYGYLLSGTREGDVRLESDDTIFVPVRGKTVTVHGEIVRPAAYELRGDETLVDVVRMAGGVTARTYLDRLHVERVLPPAERRARGEDREVVDVDLAAVLDGRETFQLRDLDDLQFLPITGYERNYVVLEGSVRRPGTYELREGMRISDLIAAADGLRGETYRERAFVVRTREDLVRQTLAFDLDRALQHDPDEDLLLAPWDEVTVFSIWDLKDRDRVSVFGAVRRPGEYELTEDMTLGDLLLKAGGFQEYAYPVEVEVSRVYPDEPEATRIADTFRVEVGEDFLGAGELPSFRLQKHDDVFVRNKPHWELQRNVTVEGEVLFPGRYTLRSPTERLVDVIERAGGLLPTAYPDGFRLDREADDVGPVSVDLRRALQRPDSDDNIVLREGDSMTIPERPMTVRVSGAVGFPTSLVYEKGKGIDYYVGNAGGYLDEAKKGEVRVVYSTGRSAKVKRFAPDPRPEPGSHIIVPPKRPDEGIHWGETIADVAQILASLATTYLVIDRIAD